MALVEGHVRLARLGNAYCPTLVSTSKCLKQVDTFRCAGRLRLHHRVGIQLYPVQPARVQVVSFVGERAPFEQDVTI